MEDDEITLTCPKDRVIIEPDPFPTESKGGILLPSDFVERPEYRKWRGVVREVGPGEIDPETGRRVPPDVKVGDRVLYDRNECEPLNIDNLTSVHARDILLKGDDVDRVTFNPRKGVREDGVRFNDDDETPEVFRK